MKPKEFELLSQKIMSSYFGTELIINKKINDFPKKFDLISKDGTIICDAKYYSLVKGERYPPAKMSGITEYVWLLEKIEGKRKFLVFGNDIRVPKEWLKRYSKYVDGIEFFFINENNQLEKLF